MVNRRLYYSQGDPLGLKDVTKAILNAPALHTLELTVRCFFFDDIFFYLTFVNKIEGKSSPQRH